MDFIHNALERPVVYTVVLYLCSIGMPAHETLWARHCEKVISVNVAHTGF